ncbi:hypothetical protein HPB49_003778 [Dermacentor silvarum]|uniref:Uncharacterized protein n=1 Tax=Dermacentor silvarum TaxID=543639 RepID=A0ACB8C147_DERSI|nr:hypothetical protein HPB49_003778 [Dermacentor silvarum]
MFDNDLDGDIAPKSSSPYCPRQFLDVGSGCGQVTMKILLPNVPDNVERIVGVDVCANMVSYAREHNSHPKLAYEQLDITGDVSEFLSLYGPFDRLYCFNSLNRVKDQLTAWRNMAKLLKPGGECLLFYGAWYVTPEIWRALAKKERWSRFAELWEGLIPPSQDIGSTDERLNYVRSLAKDVGLELRSCEMAHIYLPMQQWSAYEQLDITGDVSEFLSLYRPFDDRLYCFNSLNCVKDQRTARRNMAKLLKPLGECLLFYGTWYVTPDIWRALAKEERWARFAEASYRCVVALASSDFWTEFDKHFRS